MKRFFGVLAILILTAGAHAAACPSTATQNNGPLLPQLPPITFAGGVYYCAASPAPESFGDLTTAQAWAKHVQVCTTHCSYEPASPIDPHSMLVMASCGPGMHDMNYHVEPPPTPKGGWGALHIASTSCTGYVEKGPPAPAATSHP